MLLVLDRLGSAIPHQLHEEAGCAAPSHAHTRLMRLAKLGLVQRTAEKRATPFRSEALVWRITDEGRKTATQLRERMAA